MKLHNENNKPNESDLDNWLSEKSFPISKDFEAKTLERIHSVSTKNAFSYLIIFKNYFVPLAAAATIMITLGYFYETANNSPQSPMIANTSEQLNTNPPETVTINPEIYTDPEYLKFEELFLLQENLEILASLDTNSSLNY